MACEATAGKGVEGTGGCRAVERGVLKAHIKPWIDEAFLITIDIEGKFAQMKVMHALRQGFAPNSEHSAERVEHIQQTIKQCTADLRAAQVQLEGLRAKIAALAE